MTSLRRHSPSLLGALLFGVLLGAFAGSLHRGQMSGFELAGSGAGFCSARGDSGLPLEDRGEGPASLLGIDLQCLLCAAVDSPPALGDAWCLTAPLATQRAQPQGARCISTAPRDTWPAANPRASPVSLG
jgi:hypothetical protein